MLELDAGGGVAHRLLWGPAVDQALADETASGNVYWYLTDHLGTVRDVVDYTGGATIVNHIAYDSFGRRTSETNSALGDFDVGFTGKWFDRATGLQWNLFRWYNPEIQRWMSEDPIGFAAGDANLNRYVGNEPTGWIDPSGLHEDSSASSEESWKERWKKIWRLMSPEDKHHWQRFIDHGEELPSGFREKYRDELEGFNKSLDDLIERNKKARESTADEAMRRKYDRSIARAMARKSRIGPSTSTPRGVPRIGPTGAAAVSVGGMVAVDVGGPIANDLTGGRLGYFLDNTIGEDYWDTWFNMKRLFGRDAGYYWRNIFTKPTFGQDGYAVPPPASD